MCWIEQDINFWQPCATFVENDIFWHSTFFPSEDDGICVGPSHLGCPADATGSGGSNDDDDDDGATSLSEMGFLLLLAVGTLLC